MGKYQRVEKVPNAQLSFDTMRLFRRCKNKDKVWKAVMDYFSAIRVKGCLDNAPEPPQFDDEDDAECYESFTESIYKSSKSYWERCGTNIINRNGKSSQGDQPSTNGRPINQPSNEPLNQLVNQPSNKPSLGDVAAFIRENGLAVDAQKFYDTMKRQGWRDNAGKPINVWQAVLGSWAKPPKPVPAQAYSTQRPNTEQELEARIQEL